MALMDAELIPSVRAECGKVVNTTELEDVDIQREAGFILRRIAEKISVKALRSFTSTIDIREYDVNAATVRVQKVFRWDEADKDSMVLGGYSADEANRNERYNFPSLWAIEQMRRSRGLPRILFNFNPVTRKLTIDPQPDETGLKYWYVSIEHASWTLGNLPADFQECLIAGTTWKCFEIIMLKRSNLGGVLRDGGFVDFPAISLKGYVETKKQEFAELLEMKAMLYAL